MTKIYELVFEKKSLGEFNNSRIHSKIYDMVHLMKVGDSLVVKKKK